MRGDLAARAIRAIADGEVDRSGVTGLARRLHVSERHLERILKAELGAGPLAIAQAQRADTARTLIETTDLAFSRIALVAGYSSLRRFNSAIRAAFDRTPTELRAAGRRRGHGAVTSGERLELRLVLREPFAGRDLLAFLERRSLAGVEQLQSDGSFQRTLTLPGGHAIVSLRPHHDHVACVLQLTAWSDLAAAVQRCRALFDLDADPVGIDAALAADTALAPLVAASPGLRSPGGVDAFEMVVRAILGQVVSVETGRRVVEQLVHLCDERLTIEHDTLTHVFPSADAVAAADLSQLRIPAARRGALAAAAEAVATGQLDLSAGADRDAVRAGLLALPGIGAWTASYVLMRGFASPDEFPPGDAAIRTATRAVGLAEGDLVARTETWRPWRSYALHHLWRTA